MCVLLYWALHRPDRDGEGHSDAGGHVETVVDLASSEHHIHRQGYRSALPSVKGSAFVELIFGGIDIWGNLGCFH